eukprot:UN28475
MKMITKKVETFVNEMTANEDFSKQEDVANKKGKEFLEFWKNITNKNDEVDRWYTDLDSRLKLEEDQRRELSYKIKKKEQEQSTDAVTMSEAEQLFSDAEEKLSKLTIQINETQKEIDKLKISLKEKRTNKKN